MIYTLSACITINAFAPHKMQPFVPRQVSYQKEVHHFARKNDESEASSPVIKAHACPVGTFVEFTEKSRAHVGKILSVEHKANGGARYSVEDVTGKHYQIADKAVSFSLPCPNTPGKAQKLFQDFVEVQTISEISLRQKLEVTPDLIEIAWEECEEQSKDLTPSQFIELVHAHSASSIESYMAWKILKADLAHVFFKELKQNGRVVAFKAKARKAVEAAKVTFCSDVKHENEHEFCFV